jgi:ribosome recycling factor
VQTPDPRSLVISPYDASALGEIERAIQESDLGLTPSNDGKIIRLSIPQLTEERRKELVKVVRQIAEDGRVAVRNVRRDAIADIQSLASEVGADELHRAEEKVQKLTDDHVGQIDAALKQREADIMEV